MYLSIGVLCLFGVFSNDGMCRNSPGGLHNWSPTVSHEHHGSVV